MTIQAMQRLYADANVVGRFSENHLTTQGLLNHSIGLALRHRNATGWQALGARLAVRSCILAGTSLTMDRALMPLQAAQAFSPSPLLIGLYPAAEILFGTGVRPSDDLLYADKPIGKFNKFWQIATQHGLAGYALEVLPMALARAVHARGCNKLAQACIAGALVGRVVLQLPRAAVVLWALGETLVSVAVIDAVLLGLEGAARSSRWLLNQVHRPRPGDRPGVVHRALDGCIASLSAPFIVIAYEAAQEDDLALIAPPATPVSNKSVADRTNAAMRRFMSIPDPDADGGQRVRETADGIANDLRRFCANEPDQRALRGGLALLNDMMELTFEEANWPRPAELN